MRLNSLSKITTFLILAFLLNACAAEQKKITQQQVANVLSEIDRATQNKDMDGICDFMAKDAKISITIEGFGPTQHLTMTREEYRDNGKKAFIASSDYKFNRQDNKVTIEPDGSSATVTDKTYETVTIEGKEIRSVTSGIAVLRLENNKLVIVALDGVSKPN